MCCRSETARAATDLKNEKVLNSSWSSNTNLRLSISVLLSTIAEAAGLWSADDEGGRRCTGTKAFRQPSLT